MNTVATCARAIISADPAGHEPIGAR